MKNLIITAIVAAASALQAMAGMSNSIEYTQLYIVGSATPKGWDLANADAMSPIAYGVFEWTGELKANEEFKFMNCNYAWNKHIVATEPGLYLECGNVYPLNFEASWSLSDDRDLKMRVRTTATYTLVVDLNSMQVSVNPAATLAEWPASFYVAGSAVAGDPVELRDYYGVELRGCIDLQCGDVKLIDTPTLTASTTYYLPRFADVDITFGEGYVNRLCATADASTMGWSVLVPGAYQFYLDKASRTYTITRLKYYPVLYLVGGCCERRWNYWDESNCRFFPDPLNPDVMVWEGELRIGWESYPDGSPAEEPNRFKILTAQSWFSPTFHPYVADAPAIGATDARISGGDDLKWSIDRDGFYRLELNTRTGVLTGTYLGNEGAPARPAGIDEVTSEPLAAPVYFDLQGRRVDNPSRGIYIKLQGNRATKVAL